MKLASRADDIIVFLNGEETNPASIEQYIVSQTSEIVAALVIRAQRFQAALLLECAGKHVDSTERAIFIENIWPIMEEANKQVPSHARISKSHILFTEAARPMLRPGKGTIQGAGTLQLYQKEIDALYRDAYPSLKSGDSWTRWPSSHEALRYRFRDLICSIKKWSTFEEDTNLFAHGMDSLQALMVVRAMRDDLHTTLINPSTVYGNPTLSELAAALELTNKEAQASLTDKRKIALREKELLLQYFLNKIDSSRPESGMNQGNSLNGHTILLTGSTGSLGSYILDSLTRHSTARYIYCLNRGDNTENMQKARKNPNQLDSNFNPEWVTFLSGDLSHRTFGLEATVYQKLRSEVTTIIHNAWPVNFNISLATFRPNLDGLVNLISFAASAPSQPHLVFLSSISSTIKLRTSSGFVPETIVNDKNASAPNGYGESKYISEILLEKGASVCGIKVSIARIGQITGASGTQKGSWNTSEWFPRIIISAAHLRALPETLGPVFDNVDWIPVDQVAAILVEIALDLAITPDKPSHERHEKVASNSAKNTSASVFHLRNPYTTRWQDLLPGIKERMESIQKTQIQTVKMTQWLTAVRLNLEKTSRDDTDWKDQSRT